MSVVVKWRKSPRRIFGIPRQPGTISEIDKALADEILKMDPKFLEILEVREKERPPVVKDAVVKKTRTRPVTREKKS